MRRERPPRGAGAAFFGTKVRRYEGTKVRRYEGTKVRRYEGTKVRRYEGTKVRRYEGGTLPRWKRAPSCETIQRTFVPRTFVPFVPSYPPSVFRDLPADLPGGADDRVHVDVRVAAADERQHGVVAHARGGDHVRRVHRARRQRACRDVHARGGLLEEKDDRRAVGADRARVDVRRDGAAHVLHVQRV